MRKIDDILKEIERKREIEQSRIRKIAISQQKQHDELVTKSITKYENKHFTRYCADLIQKDYDERISKRFSSSISKCDCIITFYEIRFPIWSVWGKEGINFAQNGYAPIENDIELEAFTKSILKYLPESFAFNAFFNRYDPPFRCEISYQLSFDNVNSNLKRISDDII